MKILSFLVGFFAFPIAPYYMKFVIDDDIESQKCCFAGTILSVALLVVGAVILRLAIL